MVWRTLVFLGLIVGAMAVAKARAEECSNPDALGTSRVLTIDPRDYPRVGLVQYRQSLPLADKEVVLTFDDGPLPPYTSRILDALAEQCVKANYFIIGRMARGYPDLLRKVQSQGHVIGSHSQNHPLAFDRMRPEAVREEVEQGFASLAAALGGRDAVAPFFRIPGLLRASAVEEYLHSRGVMTWSADAVADDWKHISAAEVVRRAIARLNEKGKGILLLHDIQPATALALPELLRQLKAKGYRIVQVAPGKAGSDPVAASAPPATPALAPGALAAASPADVPAPSTGADVVSVSAVPDAAAGQTASLPAPDADAAAVPLPAEVVLGEPVRPYTSLAKPDRSMPMPGKFVTTEPGGWPPVVSVPVPGAGGIGVSPRPRDGGSPDGRFR